MDRRALTERERSVVRLVARGWTNRQIAAELDLSVATVKRHLANIMIKWDCANRTEVAIRVVQREARVS